MTYQLEVESESDVSGCDCDYKTRVETPYRLEVKEGNVSDHSCDYKAKARTTYGLEVEGGAMCQIAVAIMKKVQGLHTA
jgi:hypothetical protein